MLTPNHSIQTCGSPKIVTSTTILRNVVENQLGKAGMPHPKNPNWAPQLRKKQEVQLPLPCKLGSARKILSL